MKPGEYDDHHRNLPVFPNFQRQQPPQQQQQAFFPQVPLFQKQESRPHDAEVHGLSAGEQPPVPLRVVSAPSDAKKRKKAGDGGDEDGIEVVRRPRGRPPGSKNKPKPAAVGFPAEPATSDIMRSHILEVPAGHDIADSLARFSRRREVGLSVLSGTGRVSNVTFRQQAAGGGVPAMTFRGRLELLSLSANFWPPSFSAPSGTMSVSVAGPQGQVVGGLISGPLVAAGPVIIVAATFTNPLFHRLPMEGDRSASVSGDGGRAGGDGEARQQRQDRQQLQRPPSTSETPGAMPIYGGHLPSDAVWGSTSRGPPSF